MLAAAGNHQTAIDYRKKFPEKRSAARIHIDANIVFTRFVTKNDAKFHAKTFDHSTEGMAFESNRPLSKGDSLFIRTEDPSYPGEKQFWRSLDGKCLRTATLAEVKWCRELPGRAESNYRVGVKYASPVIS